MGDQVDYREVTAAIAPTGMATRGGFATTPQDELAMPDGRPVLSVVIVGNIGRSMWPRFRAEQPDGPNPLDAWTRATLGPIARSLGAAFVHPSDQPFRPFQRWAQRAEDVWRSPIGLLIHGEYGLWHAYRGALMFPVLVADLPVLDGSGSPCSVCADQPCLRTCPVDAFTPHGYDSSACASHVRTGIDPDCLHDGCAARRACPVGAEFRYQADQMEFHMHAFVGSPT